MSSAPEISCIIPTYEQLDLAARCLNSIVAQRDTRMEIIVSDDSRSARVADLVRSLAALGPPIRWVEGPRTGNPVDNWNAGLAEARAPLHLLVHQDERLVDPLYLRRAVDALNRTGAAAAQAGVTVTGLRRPSRFALVAPVAARVWRAQRLLLLINWIGPTAAFVFRAGHRFDPDLVQLVDVEFYRRVLETGALVRLPGVAVGSLGHHDGQISARIDPAAQALRDFSTLANRTPSALSPLEHTVFAAAVRLKRRLS